MFNRRDMAEIPSQKPNYVMSLPSPPPKRAGDYIKAYRGWVYACVSTIAERVSAVDLTLHKKIVMADDQMEFETVNEHEALSLLQHVNDFMTLYQLIEITETYQLLMGEAYWAILRDKSGRPQEIWPLRPDWVTVVPSKDNFIKGYQYHSGGARTKKNTVDFEKEDIVPFKNLNPEDAYRGMGVVKAAAQSIDIDDFSSDWIAQFFYNSALPSLVFTTDKTLKKEEIDRFLTQWNANFKGRAKSHKVGFLGGGLEPKEITQSPSDMQFLEQKRQMRDEILAAFKVPKSAVGMTEDVNRANAEASQREFMANVVKPRMTKFVEHLNEFFLRDWHDEGIFFDFGDPVPSDRELDLKVYENGLQNGWLTINEVREYENLPPAEGGDRIYLPFSVQPIGNVGEKIVNFFGGKKGDKQEGAIVLDVDKDGMTEHFNVKIPVRRLRELRRDKLAKEIKHDLKKLVTNLAVKQDEEQVQPESSFTKEKRDRYWKQMIAKTDVQEERMKEIVLNQFEDQQEEMLSNLEEFKYYRKDYRKGKIDQILFSVSQQTKKWRGVFKPFVKNVVVSKSQDIFEFLGLRQNLDLTTEDAIRFLDQEGLRFAKQVNETTKGKLREALAEGVAQEESIDQLRDRVRNVYSQTTKNRAEMIARTEVLRATNFATNETYRQSNVVKAKEWLTALDERTCEDCMDLDGEIVPVGASFSTSVGMLEYPPLHPSCRCTTIPVVKSKGTMPEETKTQKRARKLREKIEEKEKEEDKKEVEEKQKEIKKAIEEAEDKAEKTVKQAEQEAMDIRNDIIKQAKKESEAMKKDTDNIANKVFNKIKDLFKE